MNRRPETIEIKAPPVESLNKRRPSCVRRGCFTGFGCLFLFVIGGFIFLRAIATPNTVKTGLLPKEVQNVIPVYDADAIETVRVTKRSETYHKVTKNRLFGRLTQFTESVEPTGNISILPQKTEMDMIEIEWIMLSAQPSFVFRYYQDELKKAGFSVDVTENTDMVKTLIFSKDEPPLQGTLLISDTNKASGTDAMRLSVHGDLSDL